MSPTVWIVRYTTEEADRIRARRVLAVILASIAALLALLAAPALAQSVALEPACVPVAGHCQVQVLTSLSFVTTAPGATSYTYGWGDGSPPEISAVPVTSHVFVMTGTFTPVLSVTFPGVVGQAASTLPVLVYDIGLPPQAPSDIPALSTAGSLILALALAGGGIFIRRRRAP